MVLVLHIIIAVSTVGFSGLTLLQPTKRKLLTSYILTLSTFLTGTYLVIMSPSHLVSACISGIIFLGFVGSLLLTAKQKLAKANSF